MWAAKACWTAALVGGQSTVQSQMPSACAAIACRTPRKSGAGNARSPYHDRFALDRIERALQEEVEVRAAGPRLPRA